ncbi:hypothetical protein AGDE_14179 [Angomonas deanei]|nr:hypothetical protein AGDE_14179 [Angomonas deanei]|eukprot:EPY21267.1 hypothetical protein AGDE_14179 [Angomonas deanei]
MFVQGLHQLSRFISVQHDTIGVTSADVGSFIENDLFPLCGGVRFSPTLRESLLTMFFQQNNGISIKVYTLDNKNEKKGGRRGVKKEEEKGPPSPTVPLDGYVGRHSNVLRVAVSPEDKLYRPAEVHYPAPVTDKSVPLQTGKLIELLQKGAVCWSYKDWYNHENSKEKNRNSVLLQICPTLSLIGTSFSLTASDRYLNAFRLLSMTALCGFSNLIYNKDDVEKLSSMRALATPAYKLLHRSFMMERYHICQADAVQADSMAKQLIFPFFALPITSNVPPSDRALVDPVRRYYQRKREALPELKDAIYFSETSVNDVIRRSPGAKMLYMDAVHAILTAHGTDAEHIQFSHRWITVSDQHTIRKTAFHRMLLLSDLCVETILLQTASGKSKRTQLVFLNEDYSAVMAGLAEACEIVKKEETTKIKVESDNSQDEEDEEGEEDEDDLMSFTTLRTVKYDYSPFLPTFPWRVSYWRKRCIGRCPPCSWCPRRPAVLTAG